MPLKCSTCVTARSPRIRPPIPRAGFMQHPTKVPESRRSSRRIKVATIACTNELRSVTCLRAPARSVKVCVWAGNKLDGSQFHIIQLFNHVASCSVVLLSQ